MRRERKGDKDIPGEGLNRGFKFHKKREKKVYLGGGVRSSS